MCFIVEFQNYVAWSHQLLSENVPLLDLTRVRAPAPAPIILVCPMLRYQESPASLSGLAAWRDPDIGDERRPGGSAIRCTVITVTLSYQSGHVTQVVNNVRETTIWRHWLQTRRPMREGVSDGGGQRGSDRDSEWVWPLPDSGSEGGTLSSGHPHTRVTCIWSRGE